MSKNILFVENESNLKLELDNIIIEINDEEGSHAINDLECIITDNLNTHITTRLLEKLAEYNVPLIVSNRKHIPIGTYIPLSAHSRSAKVLKKQIEFSHNNNFLWNDIIKAKICNQKKVLEILNLSKESISSLEHLSNDIREDDITNREGIAAKIYFNTLMNNTFSRGNENIILNSALDYGYSIIRSCIARTCIGYGITCSLGLHHKSEYNYFNFVDDIFEPFRPILDLYAYKLMNGELYFLPHHRKELTKIIYKKMLYNNKNMELSSVIDEYVSTIASCITTEVNNIIYPHVENTEFAKNDFTFEENTDKYEFRLIGGEDEI